MKPSLLRIVTEAIAAVNYPDTAFSRLPESLRESYEELGKAAIATALGGCDFVIKATYQNEPNLDHYQGAINRKEATAFDVDMIESEQASVEDILDTCDIEIILP